MNLIPSGTKVLSDNYYCTWNTQNFGRFDAVTETDYTVFIGQDGAKKARHFLNEKNMFQPGGILDQYNEVKNLLYFVIDDGWDVPYGIHPNSDIDRFGSLELSEERFPSCAGTPPQRLRKLSEMIKKDGWRGLGIWVASQAAGESYEKGFLSTEETNRYWSERLLWSKEAGVMYWKVDWGCHQFEPEWRENLCALKNKLYPDLVVEHCWCAASPLNNVRIEEGKQVTSGRFADWGEWPEKWSSIIAFSEIFRSYDVLSQFSQLSTVDRLASLLLGSPDSTCILNCEDEVYIGAALGCCVGVMRSTMCKDIPVFQFDPQHVSKRAKEVIRTVNWQKLAPAFAIKQSLTYVSPELVSDSYKFENGETWFDDYIGKEVMQACPAVLCRGMLPEIHYHEEEKPVIVASRNPNGAISAASLPRQVKKGHYRTPLATLILKGVDTSVPVGIFGYWKDVVIEYINDLNGRQIWVQDLASDTAFDITTWACIKNNCVTIDEKQINQWGGAFTDDESEPGFVIQVL